MMQTKQCNTCGHARPLTEYYKDASSPDGHRYTCKWCCAAKKRKWTAERKESGTITPPAARAPRSGARLTPEQVDRLLGDIAEMKALMRELIANAMERMSHETDESV